MTPITTQDIRALIALAIMNNKPGLIQVMNANGNAIPADISDTDLFAAVNNIFMIKGIDGLQNILSQVPIDKSKITQAEARNLAIKYNDASSVVDPNLFYTPDWLKGIGEKFGDLLSGHTVINQGTTTITKTSAIPAQTIIIFASGAIVVIIVLAIIFRKYL